MNAGPHGFTEILYGLTSQGNNNGSAFGGLTGNTPFYNIIGAIDMLLGRFGDHDPVPRPRRRARREERRPGVPRHVPHRQRRCSSDCVIGVILIIGGLTFFPALSLGPIVEQLSHGRFF